MKGIVRFVGICAFPLVGVSVAGCASFLDGDFWQSEPKVEARAVQSDLRPSIGYYERAVTAINDRRYALALEYLQAARNQKADDVRVLTAFGVIYDKLGRFDLSARYYGQAAALDPKSRVIAADMDYSRRLQGISGPSPTIVAANVEADHVRGTLPMVAATSEVAPTSSVAMAEPDRGETVTNQSGSHPVVANVSAKAAGKIVFLTGHPLMIVDASGRSDTETAVRTYLSGLGWSVAKDESKLPARRETRIVYKDTMITAARALARTLSLPMQLTASDSVEGLQLVLGSDISSGSLAAKLQQTRQRQFALAISKPKTRE